MNECFELSANKIHRSDQCGGGGLKLSCNVSLNFVHTVLL